MKKKLFSTRFEPATVKPRNLDREREREKKREKEGEREPSAIFNFSFSKIISFSWEKIVRKPSQDL